MLGYYLRMQSLLYEINPDLTEVGPKKGKQSRSRKKPLEVAPDRNTKALLRRIRVIESDILFDIEDAREKWTELRLRLVMETAERQRSRRNEVHFDAQEQTAPDDIPDIHAQTNEEGPSIDLGDFFSSLPEVTAQGANGTSQLAVTSTNGSTVTIRDFGKWSGMAPRRVLEDACKARFVLNQHLTTSYLIIWKEILLQKSHSQLFPLRPSRIVSLCSSDGPVLRKFLMNTS